MLKRVHFEPSVLPYLLVAPQIAITVIFFLWPASQAMYQSLLIEDAFGLSTEFVWFDNFVELSSPMSDIDIHHRCKEVAQQSSTTRRVAMCCAA